MSESSAYYNPWTEDDNSLGCLRSVLQLAERTGHIKGRSDDRKMLQEASRNYKSLKQIAILKDVQEKRSNIHEVTLEIQKILQDKETKDFTDPEIMEKRAEHISSMSGHIQQLVGSKDLLISKLQQPYVGDFIKLDANYHQYVCEVLPQLVPILADLGAQLDNIEWVNQTDMADGQLEMILSEIASAMAVLQSNVQLLNNLRKSASVLHSQVLSDR